jgi:hypothetical protein
MTEEKLVEEILEIASELDRGDITFDEAQIKAQNLVRIDRYEQLIIPDVVSSLPSECQENLRQEFIDETKAKLWAEDINEDVGFSDKYVEWLEAKKLKLTDDEQQGINK